MKRIPVLFICLYIAVQGCSVENGGTDIYVMEELEVASSIEDPQKRIDRLQMFLDSYPDHYCRKFAYLEIFETTAVELGKEREAFDFIDRVEESEDDEGIMGELYYSGFSYLIETDSTGAVEYAGDLLRNKEADFRIFLYLGFDLDRAGVDEMALKMFRRSIEEAENSLERSFAGMLLGRALYRKGETGRAMDILSDSGENPFSGQLTGKILWKRGQREKALEAFIDMAAGAPGMRSAVSLDSLYALVYPDKAGQLDAKILQERIGDKRLLHDGEFTDTDGKLHRLSDLRGSKVVISAWSPD
jgi:hypothetical protein